MSREAKEEDLRILKNLSKKKKFDEMEVYFQKVIFRKFFVAEFYNKIVFSAISRGSLEFLKWWMNSYSSMRIQRRGKLKPFSPELMRSEVTRLPMRILEIILNFRGEGKILALNYWIEKGGFVEVPNCFGDVEEKSRSGYVRSLPYLKAILGERDWKNRNLKYWILPLVRYWNEETFHFTITNFFPELKSENSTHSLHRILADYSYRFIRTASTEGNLKVLHWWEQNFDNLYFSQGELLRVLKSDIKKVNKVVFDYWADYFERKKEWIEDEYLDPSAFFLFAAFGNFEKLDLELSQLNSVIDRNVKCLTRISKYASKTGKVAILDLWKKHCERIGIPVICHRKCLEWASNEENIQVLNWWLFSGIKFDIYKDDTFISQCSKKVSQWWEECNLMHFSVLKQCPELKIFPDEILMEISSYLFNLESSPLLEDCFFEDIQTINCDFFFQN